MYIPLPSLPSKKGIYFNFSRTTEMNETCPTRFKWLSNSSKSSNSIATFIIFEAAWCWTLLSNRVLSRCDANGKPNAYMQYWEVTSHWNEPIIYMLADESLEYALQLSFQMSCLSELLINLGTSHADRRTTIKCGYCMQDTFWWVKWYSLMNFQPSRTHFSCSKYDSNYCMKKVFQIHYLTFR